MIYTPGSIRPLTFSATNSPVGPPFFNIFLIGFRVWQPPHPTSSFQTHKIWWSANDEGGRGKRKKAQLILVISLFSSCLFVTVINLLLILLCTQNLFFWETKRKKNLLKISVSLTTKQQQHGTGNREEAEKKRKKRLLFFNFLFLFLFSKWIENPGRWRQTMRREPIYRHLNRRDRRINILTLTRSEWVSERERGKKKKKHDAKVSLFWDWVIDTSSDNPE